MSCPSLRLSASSTVKNVSEIGGQNPLPTLRLILFGEDIDFNQCCGYLDGRVLSFRLIFHGLQKLEKV